MLTACNSMHFGRAAAGCTKGKKYRFWNAACLAVMMDAFCSCSHSEDRSCALVIRRSEPDVFCLFSFLKAEISVGGFELCQLFLYQTTDINNAGHSSVFCLLLRLFTVTWSILSFFVFYSSNFFTLFCLRIKGYMDHSQTPSIRKCYNTNAQGVSSSAQPAFVVEIETSLTLDMTWRLSWLAYFINFVTCSYTLAIKLSRFNPFTVRQPQRRGLNIVILLLLLDREKQQINLEPTIFWNDS